MKGLAIKLERIKQGRKQLEIAHVTGIHATRLSKIENGWEKPRPDELASIQRALGINELTEQESRQM